MQSAVATTKEIDDVQIAAAEIAAGIRRQLVLQQNSCGILYYDFEAEGNLLAGLLQEDLGIPILGCSALAVLDGVQGYRAMEALLIVMTSDTCHFATVQSAPLQQNGDIHPVLDAVEQGRAMLPGDIRLVFALCPAIEGSIFDRFLPGLSQAVGHVPVIGGVPSASGDGSESIVIGEHFIDDCIALLLVSGDIRPVCSLANVISRFSNRTGTITRCEHETLYEVDGVPFVEFFEMYGTNIGMLMKNTNRTFFEKFPLLVEREDDEGDGVPFVRIISTIGEDGSANAFADFPPGATISLAVMEREEISLSVQLAIDDLLQQIRQNAADGYTYTTVLCISCAARHAILNPYYSQEGDILRDRLPKDLVLGGFYSHGELCPTSVSQTRACNCLHNGSIAFCAF